MERASHLDAARAGFRSRAKFVASPCDAGKIDEQARDLEELVEAMIEQFRRMEAEAKRLREENSDLREENERLKRG